MPHTAAPTQPEPLVSAVAYDGESPAVSRVLQHPAFIELRAKRSSLASRLTIAMLVIYYGFILLIAFTPASLATPVVGVVSLGIVLGLGVIISAIVLTGIYVSRANSQYDALIHEIVRSAK